MSRTKNDQNSNLKVVSAGKGNADAAIEKVNDSDDDLKAIAEKMDMDYMIAGKAVAGLYRTMCENAVMLPEMNLTTYLLTVINNENGLTVIFHRDRVEKERKRTSSYHHNDFDDYDEDDYDPYDEEEEGLIYDGD